MTRQLLLLCICLVSIAESDEMQYSTIGFIETLRQEKHLWRTDLIDSPTGVRYGWLIELGPITIFKIMGWRGERVTVFKFFKHELLW
jgi:hypothetical protein